MMVSEELTVRGSLVANIKQTEEMMKVVVMHNIKSHNTTVGLEYAPKPTNMYMDQHLKAKLVGKVAP